jgi:hypothetical protein
MHIQTLFKAAQIFLRVIEPVLYDGQVLGGILLAGGFLVGNLLEMADIYHCSVAKVLK